MRILAITTRFPRPGHETIAPYNSLQLSALTRAHTLRVIAPVSWTDQLTGIINGNTFPRQYVNRDGTLIYHPTFYYPPRLMRHRYGQFYLASIRRTVKNVLGEFRPHALLAYWAHPDGWATVQIARQAGLPVIIKVMGSDVLVLTNNCRRRKKIIEALCLADGVVTVSQDLANHVNRYGVPSSAIQVIPEGINTELFCPGDQKEARAQLGLSAGVPILLFVGNILFSKGCGVLVEACRLLQQGRRPFDCWLVGNGRDLSTVRTLIRRYHLDNQVHLAGAIPQALLPQWYRACDVVALPSFSEGIPNVLREAMMCGRPFVATRVGGIPEITHPALGRLVAPGSPEELADALATTLAAPPAVDPARARAFNISWDQSGQLLADCLQEVVVRRNRSQVFTQGRQKGGHCGGPRLSIPVPV
jgi:glycosyltransferase involved in cell wall biosynthesis